MCEILTKFNPLLESQEVNKLNANYEISFALERMRKNILLINSGINAKQIYVSNTTLFQVALDEYDDATLWTYLADVNHLLDFDIGGIQLLIVPPKPQNSVRFGV
jgi:hypothetical protein